MLVPGVVLFCIQGLEASCEHHFLRLNLAIWSSAGKGGEHAADASHAPIEIFAKAAGASLRTAWPRPSRPSPPPGLVVLRPILRECGACVYTGLTSIAWGGAAALAPGGYKPYARRSPAGGGKQRCFQDHCKRSRRS